MKQAEGGRLKAGRGPWPLLLLVLCLPAFFFYAAASAQDASATAPAPAPATQTPTPTPTPTPAATPAPPTGPAVTVDAPPPPAPQPSADEEVIGVSTDLTNVLLTAVDRSRRFVTTLTREDVRVLEDGVPQQLLSFERETDAPLSLALLVDASASQERVLKDEQAAARDFLASVLRHERDTAAVLSFTGLLRLEQPPTADRALLDAAVGRVRVQFPFGSPECESEDTPEEVRIRCLTSAWDAVSLASTEVLAKTPERARRAIILLSDGDDRSSKIPLYRAAEHAVRENVVVYAIGIRDRDLSEGELRRDLLRRIAEETGGRAFFPKKPADLTAAFAQIEQELRAQYLLSYAPTNRARDGSFRKIEVELTNPALRKQKLRLLYRRGYYARTK